MTTADGGQLSLADDVETPVYLTREDAGQLADRLTTVHAAYDESGLFEDDAVEPASTTDYLLKWRKGETLEYVYELASDLARINETYFTERRGGGEYWIEQPEPLVKRYDSDRSARLSCPGLLSLRNNLVLTHEQFSQHIDDLESPYQEVLQQHVGGTPLDLKPAKYAAKDEGAHDRNSNVADITAMDHAFKDIQNILTDGSTYGTS